MLFWASVAPRECGVIIPARVQSAASPLVTSKKSPLTLRRYLSRLIWLCMLPLVLLSLLLAADQVRRTRRCAE